MTSPHDLKLADWVPSFCCISPFCAMLLLAIAAICGASIGSAVMVGLICLCGKTTHWVLMLPTIVPQEID